MMVSPTLHRHRCNYHLSPEFSLHFPAGGGRVWFCTALWGATVDTSGVTSPEQTQLLGLGECSYVVRAKGHREHPGTGTGQFGVTLLLPWARSWLPEQMPPQRAKQLRSSDRVAEEAKDVCKALAVRATPAVCHWAFSPFHLCHCHPSVPQLGSHLYLTAPCTQHPHPQCTHRHPAPHTSTWPLHTVLEDFVTQTTHNSRGWMRA